MLNDCELWFGFDHSMTHEAEAPDGLDASKLNKSDGGANVPNYFDEVQLTMKFWIEDIAARVRLKCL